MNHPKGQKGIKKLKGCNLDPFDQGNKINLTKEAKNCDSSYENKGID